MNRKQRKQRDMQPMIPWERDRVNISRKAARRRAIFKQLERGISRRSSVAETLQDLARFLAFEKHTRMNPL